MLPVSRDSLSSNHLKLSSGMLPLMEMVCYLCHAIRCLVIT
jgi:hypothetical protein